MKVIFSQNLENVSWVSWIRDVTMPRINRIIVFERKMPFLAFKFKPDFKKGCCLMVWAVKNAI